MAQHLDDAAADAPRSLSMDEAAEAFADFESGEEELAEDEDTELESDETEADEADEEADEGEEQDDDEDEPEAPAIDPPASLTAEEKAKWAQLPPEAQQAIVAIESRRTTEVQQGLEKARNAQREAESAAAGRIAEAERLHAEQLMAIAKRNAPQPPDDRLIDHDPRAYMAAKARYDRDIAQHNEFVQQIRSLHEGATKEQERLEAEAITAEWQRVSGDLPEAGNPEQWQALMGKLTPLALELGYPEELLADATPSDIRAIKRASQWKDKADKWDALQSRKMTTVRAHKGKSAKPGTAQPIGSGKARANAKATLRAKQSGSIEDAAAALEHLF